MVTVILEEASGKSVKKVRDNLRFSDARAPSLILVLLPLHPRAKDCSTPPRASPRRLRLRVRRVLPAASRRRHARAVASASRSPTRSSRSSAAPRTTRSRATRTSSSARAARSTSSSRRSAHRRHRFQGERNVRAAAGDQSAVGVVASDAALNQFFYAADGIDNNNDAAAVVRALECVLKQVKDVGFAPDDRYRSGRGLSETQLKDLRDNEVRAAAPRIFIFSPIIPCARAMTRSPKSSGRSTPCSEATTRSPTSPTRE